MISTANEVRRVRRRLSREDRIGTALAALAEEGIEGVRIDRLCRELGVPADETYPLARVPFFTALGAHDAPTLFDGRSRRSFSKYLLCLVKDRTESAQR